MKNFDFKKAIPHVIAILIFLIVAIVYCLPALQGLVVNQSDMSQTNGMLQQSNEYLATHGTYPLWANSMFSGMPAYQIRISGEHSFGLIWLHNYLFTAFLPIPAGLFFLACLSFYVLTQSLKLKPWVGILAALAYGYCSYNAIIMEVGHITKFAAMGYAPAVLAGIILLMNKKYAIGFITALISTVLMVMQNHLQMVYYLFLVVCCLGIYFLIDTIKKKDFVHLAKVSSIGIVVAVLSLMSFAHILLPTQEYAKETMRGGRSELTLGEKPEDKKNKTKGGLDKDYAFMWSYGKMETFTMMLPNFYGGASGPKAFGENSKSVAALQESGLPEQAINNFYGAFSAYWGDQPGTSGPVYFGAIICMLFIASLFFVEAKYKWWLVAASVLGIFLAWGSNFSALNYFLFDHLPMYNKFRAPSSALVIPQLTIIALAALALNSIFYGSWDKVVLNKKLKLSGIATGVVALLLTAFYFTADYTGKSHRQFKENVSGAITNMLSQGQQPTEDTKTKATTITNDLSKALVEDRKSLFGKDLVRLFAFLLLGAAVIYFTVRKKISATVGTILLALLSFFDVITVCNRFLNKESYIEQTQFEEAHTATAVDNQIKQDKSFFRVFNQAGGDPFQEANTSYFHNSIGGYSPAKLGLYQDLITHQLSKGNMPTYNMLNTKYFIVQNPQNGQPMVQQNPNASGNAWFVQNIKYVNSANEEMLALDSLDVKSTAVINNREKAKVTTSLVADTSASISLVKNDNDFIEYTSNSKQSQFAVFSEIYYPHGWTAFIDGKETPIVKVNYALRGLNVPAGNHKIIFEFKPSSVKKGNQYNLIATIISITLLLGTITIQLFKKENENVNEK
ncbi:MAG: YfhO family protein [Ferruginibacter sp.]|nr:YfhO family protein [Ferruginibacter sp.]